MIKDSLGDRMKRYEMQSRTRLLQRTPVIIRIDGKAFHSFTRGFKRPFDMVFKSAMEETTKLLCEGVQNCVLGYTQSDEITLVLLDDFKLTTEQFFDNQVQKICSVTASMATLYFNNAFKRKVDDCLYSSLSSADLSVDERNVIDCYVRKCGTALFDARAFNVPKNEIINNLIWRQNDAIKNSVSQVAQYYFSPKELNNLKTVERIEKLKSKNVDYYKFPKTLRMGTLFYRAKVELENGAKRRKWLQCDEKTMFEFVKNQGYIENLINNNYDMEN